VYVVVHLGMKKMKYRHCKSCQHFTKDKATRNVGFCKANNQERHAQSSCVHYAWVPRTIDELAKDYIDRKGW
jgi:hypothetical protein